MFERNRADDTFGWGVVLSDEALGNLAENDPVSAASIRENFAYWDDVAVEFKGTRTVSGGHGFCGIGRMKLLLLLQARARELGVDLRFQNRRRRRRDRAALARLRPRRRQRRPELADPGEVRRALQARRRRAEVQVRLARHAARSSTTPSPSSSRRPGSGWVWAHAYQFDADTATFIVECAEHDLERLRLRRDDQGGVDRHLRADLRGGARRPRADLQRRPHPRLGLDQLPPRALRELVATRTSC